MGAMLGRRGDNFDLDDAMWRQTHYLVRAYTEYIARGIDRPAWFILRPYFGQSKGSIQSGLVRADWTPFPAYAAMAVMTSVLGKAEYLGRIELGELQGYVFDPHFEKEGQVAVVWRELGEPVRLDVRSFRDLRAKDVMGMPVDVSSGTIEIGRMPVYLHGVDWNSRLENQRPGPSGIEEVNFPTDRRFDVVLFVPVDRARVIRRDDEPLENWDYVSTKWAPAAYRFSPGETVQLTLEVHNFGNERATGSVVFAPSAGIEVQVPKPRIDVPPMGKATVPFTVRTTSATKEFRLKAWAEMGAKLTTPYVSLWQPGEKTK